MPGILARFGSRHYLVMASVALLAAALWLPLPHSEPLVAPPLSPAADASLAQAPRAELPLSVADLALQVVPELPWQNATIRSGDSLSSLFKRNNLNPRDLHDIMQLPIASDVLRKVLPGRQLSFSLDEHGQLQAIRYEQDALNSLVIQRQGLTFVAKQESKPVISREQFGSATINSSLFAAGQSAGLPDSVIMELANIFGYDIDFVLDLREGDQFALVYEERLVDGTPISPGPILAAEFVNQGQRFRAVRYVDTDGRASYYSPDGKSLRKAFLRAPVPFSRVSSNFNLARKHPILNTIRAHKGVDYAAPAGTPVYAAGDGRVSFMGVKGGYGRLIAIQHGNQYTTHYAHLSRYAKALHAGSRVRQGEIIGYVGASGLATAPHLHYEFLVNGSARNPRTVVLPQADPIPNSERERFVAAIQGPLVRLDARTRVLLAQAR
ncbi:peptidoglycan DD-metalloendopeptidase family protein [Permianibacter sp. IMCC34836]|uniref:OapA family protein n=1 Tax=Permianibacter fluminis TaxID=2738515 RepID=UPI0015564D10|nr:peptidoglycan DD-metalloendopeptidase family protein [Permianibacter fluminis]NQD39112.1 peptidoglycan DD-metalloendopeptidase family protein [Permianibacter fluminis]